MSNVNNTRKFEQDECSKATDIDKTSFIWSKLNSTLTDQKIT